jgi:hypothetical protein
LKKSFFHPCKMEKAVFWGLKKPLSQLDME